MIYLCYDCENTFEEPATAKQSVPYGMGNTHFDFEVCPYCNSDNFVETGKCTECERATDENDLYGGICRECIHEDCNLPITVFDFSVEIEPEQISDFAIKCLGARGINEILREYFKDISETDYNKFSKERKEYVDKNIICIGEWLEEKNNET